jgi:hypothetical protein
MGTLQLDRFVAEFSWQCPGTGFLLKGVAVGGFAYEESIFSCL